MKHSLTLFALLMLPLFVFSQSNGDFRSVQTGNWSATSTWESFDGVTWSTPGAAPTAASGTITIQTGHTVTVDAAVTMTGATVVVDGTLKNTAGFTLTSGAITVNNGGTYDHNINGSVIPTATWASGSTCLVTGSAAAFPTGGMSQAFHHFTWNCPSQGANGGPNWADGTVIGGNLTLTNSNAKQWRITNLSAGQTKTITVNGNIVVDGANALLTSTGSGADAAAKAVVVVKGNVSVSAGTWSLNNSGAAAGEWQVWGNVSLTGGSLTSGTSGDATRRILNFAGGASQSFTVSGATIGSAQTTFKVSNASAVTVGFPWSLMASGVLDLTSGRFITTSTNVITIPATGTVSNGSASGFVDGPLVLTVAATSATKTFPIGKSSVYRPVVLTLTHDAATSTTYRAEVFNAAPTSRTVPSGLDSVSSVRYYTVTKGTGATVTAATVKLEYGSGENVPDNTLLRVVKDDGAGAWTNLGGSGTAVTTGSITTNSFATLASTTDLALAWVAPAAPVDPPTVSTTAISDISTLTATSGGNVTNDGGNAVSARGVCWNTSGSPTTADSKTTDGTGNGSYTSSLTGLTAGTTYYVRAYATNSAGTAYGSEVSFTTLAALVVPTVTTTAVSNIVNTTASSGGNVTAWGGTSVTARGVCWNTTGSPTLSDEYSSNGSGTGSFTSSLGGLSLGTTYYVRAYATNSTGTAYGNEVTFSTPAPQPDVVKVVAADGSGDYTTVQAAFDAVTSNYTGKWYIYVKNGTYYEKLLLAAGKINVVLVGESRDNTILTYDDYSGKNAGSSGTSTSYSVAIDADDFEAQNITFRNTATAAQAVALRTNGDRQEYYNCKLLGYQDTYYTWGGSRAHRIYNKDCFIQGSVDFIFGRDIVLFDNCTINVIRDGGTITAANTDAGYSYGYVFKNCTITNDAIGYDSNPVNSFYLGRPWQASPRTVFIDCVEPAALHSAGWLAWNVTPALYAEYNCTGAGSGTSSRVAWSSQLTSGEAATYTIANIFAKNTSSSPYAANWTPSQAPIDYGALPVELTALTASVRSRNVELRWSTATETNNAGFEVQRKENGAWTALTFVKGAGSSADRHDYSYTDAGRSPGVYQYRVKQVDRSGAIQYSPEVTATVTLSPSDYGLSQNYPNPFNPATTVTFAVHAMERVTVKVYDLLGREVASIFDGVAQPEQLYTLRFDGSALASGIYLCSFRSGERTEIRKMSLMK